ncbi:hypothetical protein P4S93_16910 [Aneurinibacillus thermoaerophilus]|uniref:hypothetical protein n=1 Tax=Aneurinibacillus thermoaerophilus TaxID=143495 RepID=UPI002E1B23CB|nr:hypothetical protein [Aneurinibacillus thermoaerophilus]MED0762417.1 hypothetical protein [Aneurinibacillus thermoaerophilus]
MANFKVNGIVEVFYTMDVQSSDVVQVLADATDTFGNEKVKSILVRVDAGKYHMDLTSNDFDIEIKAEENWHVVEDETTIFGKVNMQVSVEIESESAEQVNEVLQGWLSDSFDEEELYLFLKDGRLVQLNVWETNISWSDAREGEEVA